MQSTATEPPMSAGIPEALPPPNLPASCEPPSATRPPEQLVWLIFGGTGHIGRSITRVALDRGDCITSVGKSNPEEEEKPQAWHNLCQSLTCEVRDRETVKAALDEALQCWGRIDVVVNATEYGVMGAFEDQDEYDIHAQFDTNVMGLVNIIQITIPYFRTRGQGRFIVMSSICGIMSMPGLGPYCATKRTIEGISESLMYEEEPFGIKVSLVEQGISRRDDSDDEQSPMWGHFLVKPPSDAYRAATSPAQHGTRILNWLQHRQPTSTVKSAKLIWELAHCKQPPLRLFLGSNTIDSVRDRMKVTIEEIEDWKHLNGEGEAASGS